MTTLASLNGFTKAPRPITQQPVTHAPDYSTVYEWGRRHVDFILSIDPDFDTKELAVKIEKSDPALSIKLWDSKDLMQALDKTESPKEIEDLIDSALKLLDYDVKSSFTP